MLTNFHRIHFCFEVWRGEIEWHCKKTEKAGGDRWDANLIENTDQAIEAISQHLNQNPLGPIIL